MRATQALELQLQVESIALVAARERAENAERASEAATLKSVLDKELTETERARYLADEAEAREIQARLQAEKLLVQAAQQREALATAAHQAEENKLATLNAAIAAANECIAAEQAATAAAQLAAT
ncbi:MAG: hypothetical protein WDM70_09890 [Nitrosomonadales bacterium]